MDDIAKRRNEKLLNEGVEHLEAGRHSEALQVAFKLESVKGPLAFYLAARVFASFKNFDSAVFTMRRGVLKRPTFWPNWFYLGIYLGRLNKYEEALAAYDQALLCTEADADVIRLNMAILSITAKAYEAALSYLDGVEGPALRYCAASSRVAALEGAGRIAEAEALAESFLEEPPEGDEEYQKEVGPVAAALARIRLQQGHGKEEVRGFLMHCLEEHGCSIHVLHEIMRLGELRYSEESRYYRMVILSKLPMGHPWYREARGYCIGYGVISDSEQRALEMIDEFESSYGVESVELVDFSIDDTKPKEPMGVYWFSERFFA